MKICLIMCYFGKLPNYIDIYLKTCSYNTKINYLLFTDQVLINTPENFKVVNISFDSFCEYIASKFEFEISISSPYKICDYRPAFGEIFSSYLQEFDFWGHCDLDMLWGDVNMFLPDHINDYDKIFSWGHLTLYKNTEENNKVYRSTRIPYYKTVFTNNENFVFDEQGISKIYKLLNKKIYISRDHMDITPGKYTFTRTISDMPEGMSKKENNYKHQIFFWKEGKVYRIVAQKNELLKTEFSYIHFQKRKMAMLCDENSKQVLVTNKGLIEYNNEINCETIDTYNKINFCKDFVVYVQMQIKRIFNKIGRKMTILDIREDGVI